MRQHKWMQPPPSVDTRSKLQYTRQLGRVPDLTYDFDGDGVVGNMDHFIGRQFDKDKDGRLTTAERGAAQEAIDRGFMGQYIRGDTLNEEQIMMLADKKRSMPQRSVGSGKCLHATRTDLDASRHAEAKAAGERLGERHARDQAGILEPQPPTHETVPRQCPISNIRERAEADHQASRLRGGLLPMTSAVNPDRELRTVGMEYVDKPFFATRGQLKETQKECFMREAEEIALKAEEVAVPSSVRRAKRQVQEFDSRRPKEGHVNMTMTRLKDQRRRDRVEHDMQHFPTHQVREMPRFSDNPEVPWWHADKPQQAMAATAPAMSKSMSEPTLKVTDVPWGHSPERFEAPQEMQARAAAAAGRAASSAVDRLGSKTVKRWTTESIERGEGHNKPRLFDNIQPVRIGPKDLESLDITSSMEPIRLAATAKMREEGKKNQGVPKRSRLWADASQTQHPEGTSHCSHANRELGPESSTAAAPRTLTRNIIQSEPALRTAVHREDTIHEPRFFGSTTHIARPAHITAVRSGGFQRVSAGTGQSPSQHTKAASRSKGDHHSKGDPVPQ